MTTGDIKGCSTADRAPRPTWILTAELEMVQDVIAWAEAPRGMRGAELVREAA